MSLTYEQALDEAVRLFKATWDVVTPSILNPSTPGDPILVQWPGEPAKAPAPVIPFARFLMRHAQNPRRQTLAPKGRRRFERTGLITVQAFGPIEDIGLSLDGFQMSERLALIARNVYEGEGTADGLWFRNARVVPIGPDKLYYQHQALIDFVYDECK